MIPYSSLYPGMILYYDNPLQFKCMVGIITSVDEKKFHLVWIQLDEGGRVSKSEGTVKSWTGRGFVFRHLSPRQRTKTVRDRFISIIFEKSLLWALEKK